MTRWFRLAYAGLAWAFLIGLATQVFLIGLYLFNRADSGALAAHQGLGWVLHLAPLLVLLFAYLARAGRGHWLWALALAVVVLIVPILATMSSTPLVAALHPVGAMISFALGAVVAWNATHLIRRGTLDGQPVLSGPG